MGLAIAMTGYMALAGCQRQPAQDAVEPAHESQLPDAATRDAQPAMAQPPADVSIPGPRRVAKPARPSAAEAEQAQVMEGIPRRIALPPADTDTPDIAQGTEVEYVCESGSTLRIGYADAAARVHWTDGRTLLLRRTQDATASDFYVGSGYSLRRIADVVQLDQAGGPTWRCSEHAANA
jgi:hypothetical protein